MVNTNLIPSSKNAFKTAVVSEFKPEYHIRRARDRPRRQKEVSSVSKTSSDLCNIVLTIPAISERIPWETFCARLKYGVCLWVLETVSTIFGDAAKTSLSVDCAFGVSMFRKRMKELRALVAPFLWQLITWRSAVRRTILSAILISDIMRSSSAIRPGVAIEAQGQEACCQNLWPLRHYQVSRRPKSIAVTWKTRWSFPYH